MIGCHPNFLAPLGSYYDFIDRLWLHNLDFEKLGHKDVFSIDENKKPSLKPGKDKKLPNRHPSITIDTYGTTHMLGGFRMVYWGYCKGRSRCKWLCPVACARKRAVPAKMTAP